MYIIYSLIDPITNEVRYVGKTSLKRQKRRLYEHITNSYKSKTHSGAWIRKLLKLNLKPIMNILEIVTLEDSESKEVYWIKKFSNLTNLTSGGERTFKFTHEVIEKLKIINSGENNPCFGKKWTEEQRRRLSEIRKGTKHTQEHKDNISKSLSKKISINGVEYKSIRYAAKYLHIGNSTIIKKLKSEEFPEWFYIIEQS